MEIDDSNEVKEDEGYVRVHRSKPDEEESNNGFVSTFGEFIGEDDDGDEETSQKEKEIIKVETYTKKEEFIVEEDGEKLKKAECVKKLLQIKRAILFKRVLMEKETLNSNE